MSEFIAKIKAVLDTSEMLQQIRALEQKIKMKINVDTGNSKKGIDNVNKSINTAQKSANSFGDTLKKSLNIGFAAAITAKGIQLIHKAFREATTAVKDFDAAITDVRTVTGASYAEAAKMVQAYNKMGKALGAITKEVTDSAVTWLRQGKSAQETSKLIYETTKLAKIGFIDEADAATYLTSALNGYKVSVDDAASVVDKLAKLDSSAAVTAGGLAEAMSRTAVSADMAGVSMDKLLGYLATVGEVTQKSMSSIGESFKSIFARISDVKSGKLELVDEDGTTELLSDVELTLKNVGIDLRATVNEYNNYGDVLDALAAKWNTLSDVQQNALVKAFAGVRQGENFRVLMENYDTASKYMQIAADSAGTAEAKFSAYLDSIAAKTKSLQAAFESLAVNNLSTELFGGIIDATTALVEFLDKTHLLQGTLAGLAAAGAIKGFTVLATGISNAAIKLNEFNAALKLVRVGNIGETEIQQLARMTANLSESQLRAVLSSKALSNEQRIAILTSQGLSTAEAKAALSALGLSTAEGAATASTFSLSGALKGLWATIMSNPIGLLIAAVSAIVTVTVSAYQTYKQHMEDAKQASLEAGRAAQDEATSLLDLYNAYQKANAAYKSNTGSKESLESATEGLLKALGVEESEIQRLIEEYGNLDDAIDNVTRKSLREKAAEILSAYGSTKDDALDAAADSMGHFSGSSITVKTNGDNKKFAQVLVDNGFMGYGENYKMPALSDTIYTGINDYGDYDSLVEGYNKLIAMREALLEGVGTLYTSTELTDAQVYKDISGKIRPCLKKGGDCAKATK